MPKLYSTLALGDFSVNTPPGSPTHPTNPGPGLLIPIPKSWPDEDIAIYRAVCRIHLISRPARGMYSTTLFLIRASDSSLIGGCATDVLDLAVVGGTPVRQDVESLSDREFDHTPNFFLLEKEDSLMAVYRSFMEASFNTDEYPAEFFIAKLDIIFSYALLGPSGNPI